MENKPTVGEFGALSKARVLLVEDSPDNRLLIWAYLSKSRYEVEMAENGEEACGRVQHGDFDAVLMDMQMPVMDGLTATRKIREWERETGRKSLPIIALTANAMVEDAKRSKDAGCNAHLTKPISKLRLMEALDRLELKLDQLPSAAAVPDRSLFRLDAALSAGQRIEHRGAAERTATELTGAGIRNGFIFAKSR